MHLLLLLTVTISLSAGAKTVCLGPDSATKHFVFLHGSGGIKNHQMKVLEKLAKRAGIQIAIAKTDWECKNNYGDKCWVKDDKFSPEVKRAQERAEEAADDCFRGQDYGLFGFSSGSKVVNDIVRFCIENHYTELIGVGSAVKTYNVDRQGLKGCGPKLTLLVGRQDPNFAHAQKYVEEMKSHGAEIRFISFDGGHELDFSALEPVFKSN